MARTVGYSGTGTFIQCGGTNNLAGYGSLFLGYTPLYLGYNSGSNGTYTLSSGSLYVNGEMVGYSGTGTFTQSGGTNNLGSFALLYLGYNSGSNGTYTLSSGSLYANGETVGYSGTGTFTQCGGTNTLGSYGSLVIGDTSGNGTYRLSGSGSLSASTEYIGTSGTGTFVQTGGSNAVGFLSIGNSSSYQFSGGTLQITGNGLVNQGVFNATNSTGILNVTGERNVVDLSQANLVNTGSMSLSVGPNSLLLVPAGFNPTTAFQSYTNHGLMHNVGTPLTLLPGQGFQGCGSIPDLVNCQGTISLAGTNGGWINLSGGVMVSGSGNVSLGGGTLTVNSSQSGIIAGTLTALCGNVGTSGNGTFSQSGGVVRFGDSLQSIGVLSLGCSSGCSGAYNLSMGTLYANTENIGGAGAGAFSQTGGSNSAAYLNIGSLGCYKFGGGTLQVAGGGLFGVFGGGLVNQGVFDGMGSAGLLSVAGSAIVDFSTGTLQNTASMSLSIGPNSLLLVPAGFNPVTVFGYYVNQGLTHTVGTPLTISSSQSFSGNGSIADYVNCQGTISAGNGSINLNGGLTLSNVANVNFGAGEFTVNNTISGITAGSLVANYGYIGYSGTALLPSLVARSLTTRANCTSATNSLTAAVTISAAQDHFPWASNLLATRATAPSRSGGSNGNSSSSLYIGYNATASGSYNLSGSGPLSTGFEFVGYSGNGAFTQSGGSNGNSSSSLYVGYNVTASGSYNLSGSGSLSMGFEFVGYSGNGAFTQSGGSNSTWLDLGYNAGSSGSYTLSGSGELGGSVEFIGFSGNGSFIQSGGINGLGSSNQLLLGCKAGSTGSYTLSGSGVVSTDIEEVGEAGMGLWNQSGGTNTVSGLELGAEGTYNFAGGALVVNSIGGAGAFNFGGGTLNASAAFATSQSMTLTGSGGNANINTAGYAVTLAGPLSGPGGLNKWGAGVLTLAGSNGYSGGTAVNAGAISLNNASTMPNSVVTVAANNGLLFNSNSGAIAVFSLGGLAGSGNICLADGAYPITLSVGGNGATTTYSGGLSGDGGLTVVGNGTLVLTASNTYTGSTTVNQGGLVVNGSLASPVTVNSGGTLGGTGSLTSVTVNAGGQLAPGNPLGTLSVGGNLILSAGAAMDYELDTPSTSSMISASSLTLNSQQFSDFRFTWTSSFGPGSYPLIAFGSSSGSLGANHSGTIDGLPAALAVQGNELVLNVTPEPSTLALLAVGAIGLAGYGLRRRAAIFDHQDALVILPFPSCQSPASGTAGSLIQRRAGGTLGLLACPWHQLASANR